MIPWPRLNVAAVITSQPPHRSMAARVRFVRRAPRVITSVAASSSTAAGSSQLICPPYSALNIRIHPVGPHRLPTGTLAADAARLVAGQPPEAVVAEEQVENAVVLGPTDVRTPRGGNQLDDGHPPAAGRDHGGGPREQLRDAPAQRRGSSDEVRDSQGRHHEQRLKHLGQEPEA